MTMRPLTPEELDALKTFAAMHGRTWKSKLTSWWQNPGVVNAEWVQLVYALRNSHGPSWLVNFKLESKS